MKTYLKHKLDQIEDPYLRAFFWRVYNTFFVVFVPLFLSYVYVELGDANGIEVMATWQFWGNVIYTTLLALLSSTLAGGFKVLRMDCDGTI